VRCFAFTGEGGVREVEVGGEKKVAWTPKAEGWSEGNGSYLTVNASTLEARQEGLDMREWSEKGWIAYLEFLDGTDSARLREPYAGGMY